MLADKPATYKGCVCACVCVCVCVCRGGETAAIGNSGAGIAIRAVRDNGPGGFNDNLLVNTPQPPSPTPSPLGAPMGDRKQTAL